MKLTSERVNHVMDLAFQRLNIPFHSPNDATPKQAQQVLIMREVMQLVLTSFLTSVLQDSEINHLEIIETIRALLDSLELMFKEAGL